MECITCGKKVDYLVKDFAQCITCYDTTLQRNMYRSPYASMNNIWSLPIMPHDVLYSGSANFSRLEKYITQETTKHE